MDGKKFVIHDKVNWSSSAHNTHNKTVTSLAHPRPSHHLVSDYLKVCKNSIVWGMSVSPSVDRVAERMHFVCALSILNTECSLHSHSHLGNSWTLRPGSTTGDALNTLSQSRTTLSFSLQHALRALQEGCTMTQIKWLVVWANCEPHSPNSN